MAMATHINSERLRQVVTDKLDLTMDELRHLQKCEECLDALAKLRNESRKAKPKGTKKTLSIPRACEEKQQLILAYQAETQGYSAAGGRT
jgi:hypothetical protein